MNELEAIKEKIRTIDPKFTDELVELLCEYINIKSYKESMAQLKNNKDFEELLTNIIENNLINK